MQDEYIKGEAGSLQLRIELPARAPEGVAVICHPHPLYGGSMDNKVAWTLARSALLCNQVAVRFNFRGVGQSAGAYADGVGEAADAAAVFDYCRRRWPELPVTLMGFSFGAAVALRLSREAKPARLVTIAPPLFYFDGESIPCPPCPWLVVHGDSDEVVDWKQTQARLQQLNCKFVPEVSLFPGTGHFFHGQLNELRTTVQRWLEKTP